MGRTLRVVVIGAGAVGGYFGGRLCRAGHAVSFVARGVTAARLRAEGLMVQSVDGDFRVPVAVVATAAEVPEPDLVLVAVKSYDTEAVAATLRHLRGGRATVLSLQNGIDNEAVLARAVGDEAVLPGIAYIAAERVAPNVIRHQAAGRVAIGESTRVATPRLEWVAEAFTGAGVPCMVSPDIWRDKWAKLVWNATFNVVSVLTQATLDRLAADAEAKRVLDAAMAEVAAVAQAEGHALGDEVIHQAWQLTRALGPARTSMLQDLDAGRPLELDALTGAVLRRARQRGIPTPVLDTLYACARFRSQPAPAGADPVASA